MKTLIQAILIGLVLSSAPALAKKSPLSQQQANSKQAVLQLKVNLNNASAEELSNALTGVGLTKALAIVNYRKANGPFKTLGDLAKVKGIGAATIEKNINKLDL